MVNALVLVTGKVGMLVMAVWSRRGGDVHRARDVVVELSTSCSAHSTRDVGD